MRLDVRGNFISAVRERAVTDSVPFVPVDGGSSLQRIEGTSLI
jgi:hypothetical protein